MSDAKTLPLSPHTERSVAVAAGVDPRTVRAYLRGERTRSTTAARIVEALRSHGIQKPPVALEGALRSSAD